MTEVEEQVAEDEAGWSTEWRGSREKGFGGGRGSYFAFLCVSSWALHLPSYNPVILLPLEAWTNARGFNALVYSTYRS